MVNIHLSLSLRFHSSRVLEIILRAEFIQGCLRDELLRKILAPNTAILTDDDQLFDETTTSVIETNANI